MLQHERCPPRGVMHCTIVPAGVASDLYNRDPAGADGTRNLKGIAQHGAEKLNNRPAFVLCNLSCTV